MQKIFSLLLFFTFSLLAADAIICSVINEDEILKIKCKYKTVSKEYDRNITITWISPTTHQDDRLKTIVLPAHNVSAYDYRNFDGRADGSWTVSATDESTEAVTTTQFIKEDLAKAYNLQDQNKDTKK